MARLFDERGLQRVWYEGRAPGLVASLLERIYRGAVALRRMLYRTGLRRTIRLAVPVVVVGNVTAGGTGKTPLTIALVEALRERGWHPGVISRGFGGSVPGPRRVDAGTAPQVAGDEPCLIARATAAPVAIGRDRAAAGALLLTGAAPPDVLIADDGLQHYRLARDLEICVIDGERRFGNGRLLPAGPLREPAARAQRCEFRVVNGGAAGEGETAMRLGGDLAIAIAAPARSQPLAAFAGTGVHGVAGIGNPSRFFAHLRAAGLDVVEHPFPDHHAFGAGDLAFGDDLPVLMTDKDAVKCEAFADARCWRVPVRAQLAPAFFDAVAARLRR